jgi:pilus assembly protein CpaE
MHSPSVGGRRPQGCPRAKGGVGATTVAVNVATVLARLQPSSTLLIDLHTTYGDAAVYLGAEPRFSIVDALENMHRMDATFLKSMVTPTKAGVQLLASSDHQVTTPMDISRVRTLIELASGEFPYVVLDVPRSDALMLDALKPAGAVIIVANQELATVRSAGRMATSMEKRYSKERVSVVLTRFTEGADIGQKDVERVVGRSVSYLFPNNYQVAVESQTKGRPIVLDNHSQLSSAFTGYARALAKLPVLAEKAEKPTGLLARFGGKRR